jgi:hypothetical protein
MRAAIDSCLAEAQATGRISVVIIGATAKTDNPPFIIGPTRESEQFVGCYFIVAELQYVAEICGYADGRADYIFVDVEGKGADAAKFAAAAREAVHASKLKTFKGNDITALACDILLAELQPDLNGRKAAVIGAGNLGCKTALQLAERGAHVHLVRRDNQGPAIAAALNAILPRHGAGVLYSERDAAAAASGATVLIGFTQGLPVIDQAMTAALAPKGLIVDGGIGTIREDAIAEAKRLGHTIMRLDARIAFAGVIDAILRAERFLTQIAGVREQDGRRYVAGGIIGAKNDIVVYDIRDLTREIGRADGKGGILR